MSVEVETQLCFIAAVRTEVGSWLATFVFNVLVEISFVFVFFVALVAFVDVDSYNRKEVLAVV